MSLRRDRPRQRKENRWVSALVWRALFRCSPLLSLLGAAAGGIFLVRVILVSSSSEYAFGADIPLLGIILVAWGVGVWAFLSPPDSALAHERGGVSQPLVIWSLGRRFRFWNVIAAPILGLLLVMLSGPVLDALAGVPSSLVPGGMNDPALPAIAIAVVLGAYFAARLPLWGAEMRGDRLIVRGFLLTRRYRRSEIESVRSSRVSGLADWMLGILMNSPTTVFYALRVHLKTGRTKVLYASHSSKSDIDRAARIVTAWLASEDALVSVTPSAGA